jgi:exopolysaccharide production protein ExoZ
VIKALHTTLPLPSKIRQIDGLQILRAVAVLLVAWLHSSEWLYPFSGKALPNFGVYGIDIFFVISGFIVSSVVLRNTGQPGAPAMWTFLLRRLVRIFPIYWVVALLRVVRLVHSHQFQLRGYLPALFLLPNPHSSEMRLLVDFSWTLMFEMFFYYTLALLLFWTVRRAIPASIALFCGAVIAGAFFDIKRPIWIILCNPMLLEFVFGAILAICYRRFGSRRRIGIAMVAGSVGASFLLLASSLPLMANGLQMIMMDAGVIERVMTWGVAALLLVGGVVFWSPSIETRLGRVVVVLGNASYSAYLMSAMVIEFTMRLLLKTVGGKPPLSVERVVIYQTIGTIAVFGVGWLCYQCIEWPMLRWLQARFLSRGA